MKTVAVSILALTLTAAAFSFGKHSASCPAETLCVGHGQRYSTIQAAANAAKPGQTVLVEDGTYAGFHSVHAGTATAPIIFKAHGAHAVINSAGDSNGDCINIENTDDVIVDGFHLTGCGRAAIRAALATGVIIRNNVITDSGMWGIFTAFAPKVQILNNKVSQTRGQHGIYVSNSDVQDDDPVIRGALIEGNLVHDSGNKGFSLIDVQWSRIQNNIIYNNGLKGAAGGIHLAEQDTCTQDPSSYNVIVNNTIIEPHIAAIRITTGTHNVIFNNIAISYRTIADETDGPNAIDRTSNIQGKVSADMFVNAPAHDFHLLRGAPVIDAGLASYQGKAAPAVDFDGNKRPQGKGFDIGAYEYIPTK